jgi:BirA family biotin operon repressor/biotin-[acetyl-CoA-carboxylase] ligase
LIETVSATGSTNADLIARLRSSEVVSEGHWLVADRQTAGKGRLDREWVDGAGNFMGSTVVRLGHGDPAAPTLALLAGLAVHETVVAVAGQGAGLVLKWPNDLLAGTAKLAGILLERSDEAVVVGVGVNLVEAPALDGRAVTSLRSLGVEIDRDAFAVALAEQFAIELDRWRTAGVAPIVRRWVARAHPEGTPLRVIEPGGAVLTGDFAGLSDDGTLQLRFGDGTRRAIHAGDVELATPDQ